MIELELCRRDVRYWFDNWVWTYDPRLAALRRPSFIPMDLFPKQRGLLTWIEDRIGASEDGLAEKSRDVGFTWVCGGFAVHAWRFHEGFKTTFGSRKEEYVDRLGNPDSIFEKMRLLIRALPRWMWPPGYDAGHDNYMRLLNPDNGNTISGEAGDQMGRGGRSTLYIIDEAAFIEHADRVDAATSATADVRIWGSSANGPGNLFFRKRHGASGMRPEQIYRLHWTDDPRKTQDWADKTKKKLAATPHAWASEYDIDYTASVEGICIPGHWVQAAKRIQGLLIAANMKMEPSAVGTVGGDVGAGKAKSVAVARFGSIVLTPRSWGDPDTIETAHRLLDAAREETVQRGNKTCRVGVVRYDSIGVGHGITSVMARASTDDLRVHGTNVGLPPSNTRWEDDETSAEKFGNSKAEAWWLARERFKATYEMSLFLLGEKGGQQHPVDELISIPGDDAGPDASEMASQLSLPKYGRNEKGKIVIESKDKLAARGIPSPDHAEALILTFVPEVLMPEADIGGPIQVYAGGVR